MTPERKAELRKFFVSNLFANEILDALDASETAHTDAVRMVGALVVETDEETQERAKARYAASPGPVHDLVSMAQEVERFLSDLTATCAWLEMVIEAGADCPYCGMSHQNHLADCPVDLTLEEFRP